MKKSIISLLAMLAFTGLVPMAQAATQYKGVNVYVTGGNPPLDGWNPGGSAAYQLLDDGTGGDAVADDGIFSRDITVPATGAFEWKAASTGFGTVNLPQQNNSKTRETAAGTVKFLLGTTTQTDGFFPAVDYLYTVPAPINPTTDTVAVTGDFLHTIGGSDWDGASTLVKFNDLGTSGDLVAGDGIMTARVTGIAAGNYNCKFVKNKLFDINVGQYGYNQGNIPFTVIGTADVITFQFKPATGRYKITNPNAVAGPPWYATSTVWGATLTSATKLYDDGTHGDVTANDGVYAREFIATAAGTTNTLRIQQGVGTFYPADGAGYPFHSVVGQHILVQFTTATLSDGYVPSTRFCWTDPDSRETLNYVQATGNWMADAGMVGNWSANDSNAQLLDGGANGDVTANDGIYARSFTLGVTLPQSYQMKVIGQLGFNPYQLGAETDGFIYAPTGGTPNIAFTATANPVTFQADVVTGRVGVGTAKPTRPATINQKVTVPNAAGRWTIYN